MRRFFFFLFLILTTTIDFVYGQEYLPNISVISHNGKVVVSWQNNYKKPISNILIQRSYDSLKNFSTIGTVLNPLNKENGYMDANPPYKRMFYRVSISFEGGAYEIGKSVRPDLEMIELEDFDVTSIPKIEFNQTDSLFTESDSTKIEPPKKDVKLDNSKEVDSIKLNTSVKSISIDSSLTINNNEHVIKDSLSTLLIEKKSTLQKKLIIKRNHELKLDSLVRIKLTKIILNNKIPFIQWEYPSNRVFTNNQNNLAIQLKKTASRKYSLKIYDENDKVVLFIQKITEDLLYLDKSNFRKTGWYHFEILNDGELIEKNRFQIIRDKSQK